MATYPQSRLIHKLFTKGQPLVVGRGEIIMGNEAVPDGVYYINTGYVKVYSISDVGDEYLHVIYGSGEIFPLIWAYLNALPGALYYQTLSDCEFWRISRDAFNEQLQLDRDLALALAKQLARQLSTLEDRVENLEYKKIDERVVYLLLALASRFGRKEGTETVIDVPLTHEIFADSIKMARESVSRAIEKLTQQKIIKKSRGRIHILDMGRLTSKLSRPVNFDNWSLK